MNNFEFTFNHIPALIEALPKIGMDAITKVGFDIEAHAKANASEMGAVDTGNMMNSVYTSAPGKSSYSGGNRRLPEEKPSSDTEVVVGVGADYSIYVDAGTHRMPGRPFFSQAVYTAKATLDHLASQVLNKGIEDASK